MSSAIDILIQAFILICASLLGYGLSEAIWWIARKLNVRYLNNKYNNFDVSTVSIEEKPDVTYSDVGGCEEQFKKLKKVVETPLLHPERYVEVRNFVVLFGPSGTGKKLCARAVANRTDACFIRVNVSELFQKYVGEEERIVSELLELARSKKRCLIFFDEIDAIFSDEDHDGNILQRIDFQVELECAINFRVKSKNVIILVASNSLDIVNPMLEYLEELHTKVEFVLPDLAGRTDIFMIHARSMSVERDIRYELLARLCPNSTGAEIRSVCTEARMFATLARREVVTEDDFLKAIKKVIKPSSTHRYIEVE